MKVQEFLDLIKLFIDDTISAQEFEKQYILLNRAWGDKNWDFGIDDEEQNRDIQRILGDLFIACDVFCGDPLLRQKNDLDDMGLKREAQIAFEKLQRIKFH